MKYLKWLVLILAIFAVVLAIANLRRDAIGKDVANRMLKDSDYRVVALSVERLGVDQVEFASITIQGAGGMRISVRGLSVPSRFPDVRPEAARVDEITVQPGPPSLPRAPYVPVIQALLGIPEKLPRFDLSAGRVTIEGYPPLEDVNWKVEPAGQQTTFRIDALQFRAELRSLDEEQHVLTAVASRSDAPRALELSLRLNREEQHSLQGQLRIQLQPMQPLLQELGLMPDEFTTFKAELAGPLGIELDQAHPGELTASAQLALLGEALILYRAVDRTVGVTIRSDETLETEYFYPSNTWRASLSDAAAITDVAPVAGRSLDLDEIDCTAGITCELVLNGSWPAFAVGEASASELAFTAPLRVRIEDTTRITLSDHAQFRLTGLSSHGFAARDVDLRVAGGELLVGNDSVNGRIDSLSGSIAGLTTEALPGWPALVPLRIEGHLRLVDDRIDGTFSIGGEKASLLASAEAGYSWRSPAASIQVSESRLFLDRRKLSKWFESWPFGWDLVSGRVNLEGSVNYDGKLTGRVTLNADELLGAYDDIAFAGASANMTIGFDGAVTVEPVPIEVALIDIGFPMENVVVLARPELERQFVHVEKLGADTLGGVVTARPFSLAFGAEANEVMLEASRLQLPLIVGLLGSTKIEARGTVSGMLPVVIRDRTLTISDGHFSGDPPGGTIRYTIDAASLGADGPSGMMTAIEMLSLFEYDSLESDVSYTENGDLVTKMKLKGINPNRDPNQPVVLNLRVENNVPQLLKSLQAIRSIEDILGKRARR